MTDNMPAKIYLRKWGGAVTAVKGDPQPKDIEYIRIDAIDDYLRERIADQQSAGVIGSPGPVYDVPFDKLPEGILDALEEIRDEAKRQQLLKSYLNHAASTDTHTSKIDKDDVGRMRKANADYMEQIPPDTERNPHTVQHTTQGGKGHVGRLMDGCHQYHNLDDWDLSF